MVFESDSPWSPPPLPEHLAAKAIPQSRDGSIGGAAWSQADALDVIAALESTDVPIAGGDVLRADAGSLLTYTYEDWHCDPDRREPRADYAARSRLAAHEFIASYPNPQGAVFAPTFSSYGKR